MKFIYKNRKTLPGRNLTLFYSLTYLGVLVVLPLIFLILSIKDITWGEVVEVLQSRRVLEAFRVSFIYSFLAAVISLILGIVIGWVLVKYDFLGKRFFDSIIDLPFAMPTAVSGIALATIYAENGWMGQWLGIKVSYTPLGILIALIFIGLPFVVRAIQPAVLALDRDMEEAALSLGATQFDILRKIIFPQLLPSMITGFTMSLARGLGEYGSVIFIAGNIPFVTEIVPLLIVMDLEQFNYQAAIVLAVAMLLLSFLLLLGLGYFGRLLRKRYG